MSTAVGNTRHRLTALDSRPKSAAEMTEFIEEIRRLAAEMGCAIPSPGEIAT